MRKILLALFLILGMGHGNAHAARQEVLTQVSTMDALIDGVYDGEVTVDELSRFGDFGLGTFNALDGEMAILDGRIYQVSREGSVHLAEGSLKTPFASLTFFHPDQAVDLPVGMDFESLKRHMDGIIPTRNIFYALRIEGTFDGVKMRSVPRQDKPYRPMPEVIQRGQVIYEAKNVRGTLLGFRCPPFAKGLNVPGYHFHFLSEDFKTGGHVLGFTVQKATAKIAPIPNFQVRLPDMPAFYGADLSADKEKELAEVERAR